MQTDQEDQRGAAASLDHVRQQHLDALVTHIAVQLMRADAATLVECLEGALRDMNEFFEMDTCFIRSNDFDRDATVLVAEWPKREHVPDPDPLGVVPFGADPVFDATRTLQEPFLMRPDTSPDSYQERVQEGSGVQQVSMAMVPLLAGGTTQGVLGFIKFGDRGWDVAETNALQAVASIVVQLQARVVAEERLQHLAFHDALTGLPNRRALLEELLQRAAEMRPTTLLFLDLDRFKVMNDFVGHGAGDELLRAISRRLEATAGDRDFVARLAGDEFVVLFDALDPADALLAAERVRHQVAAPIDVAGHLLTRSASVGIANGVPSPALLAHADTALHRAKSLGGDQVVVFDEHLRAEAEERSDTELLLREAIDAKRGLLLHYQPEFDLRTGELLAVEALLRWNHPERGRLTAGAFISVAEETGLVADLGSWVLDEACRQLATWRRTYSGLRMMMRVNMSAAQLNSHNIVDLVAQALRENDLPGRFLCLEITEHAVMQDVDAAVRMLHQLKSLGVHLAIDDFGVGFSSMTQLKRLPVDVLKIDRAFVSGVSTDNGDRAIVDATVRLAHAFGLDVVAEGIEERDVVPELLALGCHRAQGYLLCMPSAPEDLMTILADGGVGEPTWFPSVPLPQQLVAVGALPA